MITFLNMQSGMSAYEEHLAPEEWRKLHLFNDAAKRRQTNKDLYVQIAKVTDYSAGVSVYRIKLRNRKRPVDKLFKSLAEVVDFATILDTMEE